MSSSNSSGRRSTSNSSRRRSTRVSGKNSQPQAPHTPSAPKTVDQTDSVDAPSIPGTVTQPDGLADASGTAAPSAAAPELELVLPTIDEESSTTGAEKTTAALVLDPAVPIAILDSEGAMLAADSLPVTAVDPPLRIATSRAVRRPTAAAVQPSATATSADVRAVEDSTGPGPATTSSKVIPIKPPHDTFHPAVQITTQNGTSLIFKTIEEYKVYQRAPAVQVTLGDGRELTFQTIQDFMVYASRQVPVYLLAHTSVDLPYSSERKAHAEASDTPEHRQRPIRVIDRTGTNVVLELNVNPIASSNDAVQKKSSKKETAKSAKGKAPARVRTETVSPSPSSEASTSTGPGTKSRLSLGKKRPSRGDHDDYSDIEILGPSTPKKGRVDSDSDVVYMGGLTPQAEK
ncbi:hypothetical protein DFP72DRAFT_854556 [Ephemerocybe angulata]|uniref:Uncharacterized protein n=1 Tax=Ephemerocybe angulata TaxID=980116 RepID=A0A8H6HIZ5_9AGAR|nr:hypothetical protein DFP72DRAFT_854556 [Tulosesus angulatus]